MKLLSIRLHCPETLGDLTVSFAGEDDAARPFTLVYGAPGSGKTTLLSAICNTRPGHTVVLAGRPSEPRCYAECAWQLGLDEPGSERVLVLQSPNAPADFARQNVSDRRDVVLAERLAREGGFVSLVFSALRWFSRSPLLLAVPERSAGRTELRGREALDDAARNDLTREVKQALAYAAIVRALPQSDNERHHSLGDAMADIVSALAQLGHLKYAGLDPRTLEPRFLDPESRSISFDGLPTHLKHCVAFGALTVRALWNAYPGIDPRRAEGVVAIDEIDLHQDTASASRLMDVLAQQLPAIQWILTTRSSELLACREKSETLALRRLEPHGHISVHVGPDAQVH